MTTALLVHCGGSPRVPQLLYPKGLKRRVMVPPFSSSPCSMSSAGGSRNAGEWVFMECLLRSGRSTRRSDRDPIDGVIPVVLNSKGNRAQRTPDTGNLFGTQKYLEMFLIVMTGKGGLPLASHGWKLGILLSIPQWTGRSPQ